MGLQNVPRLRTLLQKTSKRVFRAGRTPASNPVLRLGAQPMGIWGWGEEAWLGMGHPLPREGDPISLQILPAQKWRGQFPLGSQNPLWGDLLLPPPLPEG